MAKKKLKITDVMTKVVELLLPLASEEREKVIKASLALLGENAEITQDKGKKDKRIEEISEEFNSKVKAWMRQNNITSEILEQVFQIDNGNVEVIASQVPGKNGKDKTINAYVLEGVCQLLASGDAKFTDKSARDLCRHLGCYNSANHSAYMQAKGNALSGSKEKGWSLTAPGLRNAAELIKDIVNN